MNGDGRFPPEDVLRRVGVEVDGDDLAFDQGGGEGKDNGKDQVSFFMGRKG